MRVLHLTPWFPTAEAPHWGIFVQRHAECIGIRHPSVVLHLHGVHRLRATGTAQVSGTLLVARYYSRIPVLGPMLQMFAALRALRHYRNPIGHVDVVHAHIAQCLPAAVAVAIRLRRPLVLTEHSSQHLEQDPSHFSHRKLTLMRMLGRRVRRWSAVSEPLRDAIVTNGVLPAMSGQVIPNVVTSTFRSGAGGREPRSLLWVGGMSDYKDPLLLVEAMELVCAPLRVDFVGEGPLEDAVRAAVRQTPHASGVRMLGAVAPDRLAQLMRQSSALVITSRFETFSVVAAEALASGLPVVTTPCGGPEGFVGSTEGIVAADHSAARVAEAIEDALVRSWDHKAMAERAAARFSGSVVGSAFDSLYESAVR